MRERGRSLTQRSRERCRQARAILDELGLIASWSRFGRPVVVGAVAYELVLDPDIDLEIYCPRLDPADGFAVLARAARCPGMREGHFENHLSDPDKALYWRIDYRDAVGEAWKIDMWSAPDDYPLPRGEHLVGPLRRALTPELREAILRLKSWRKAAGVSFLSIDLYRAVVDGGVRQPEDLALWLSANTTGVLTDWAPSFPK